MDRRSSSRGPLDARHQFVVRGGFSPPVVTISVFARVMSGIPFTPVVAGDVNGDGSADDRAFVFPSPSTDVLIASSSLAVRECLLRQRNLPAARYSCEGTWTASLNAQIDSLWLSLATNFAELGEHYGVASAVARQEDALAQGREITRLHLRATLGDILTPIQLQLMPYAGIYRSATPVVQGGRTLSP